MSFTHNVKNLMALTTAFSSDNSIKLGASSQNYRKLFHVFAAMSKQAISRWRREDDGGMLSARSVRYRKQFCQFRWLLPSSERALLKVTTIAGGGSRVEEDVLIIIISKTIGWDKTSKAFSGNYNWKSFSFLIFWTVALIKYKARPK